MVERSLVMVVQAVIQPRSREEASMQDQDDQDHLGGRLCTDLILAGFPEVLLDLHRLRSPLFSRFLPPRAQPFPPL